MTIVGPGPRHQELRRGGRWTYPDVPKDWAVRTLAVLAKVLRDDGGDGHSHTDEAVMIDADPDDVKPSQSARGRSPRTPLAAAALGEPADGQNPRLDGAQLAEEFLLLVEIGTNIVA